MTMERSILEYLAGRKDSLPQWARDLLTPYVKFSTFAQEVTIPNEPTGVACSFCGWGQQGTHHICSGLMYAPHQHDWRVASVTRTSGSVSPGPGSYSIGLECFKNHKHQKWVTLDSLPPYPFEIADFQP